MRKTITLIAALVMLLSLCACKDNTEKTSTDAVTKPAETTSDTKAATTANKTEIELTVDNIEQYLSFEISKEMSEYNSSAADHILKISPLVEGDFSGIIINITIPLYDHWYNSYTHETDLSSEVVLTASGGYTAKHSVFVDTAGNYETRGTKDADDPEYIINSVSGTIKQ